MRYAALDGVKSRVRKDAPAAETRRLSRVKSCPICVTHLTYHHALNLPVLYGIHTFIITSVYRIYAFHSPAAYARSRMIDVGSGTVRGTD